ncbi:MAG: Ku protein [Jatrophihabitans sp.]|uniref:non-homologous end joining protein Ku n=1 Tax=Jatrophihabitans sp. TaxID=1932789 RepID=UPI00390F8F2D
MARAIWSGVLSFGLVSVPIEIYSATEAHEPSFHQYEKGTKDRIRYQRVNERTGKEVEYADIVKGIESGRTLIQLDQDELDAVAPGRSRAMEIDRFVDLDEIDPIYFAKTYFLGPKGEENKKTYALLRDAMAATNRAAIASFVMRGKEYLAAVRPDGDVLALETMFFADEVRTASDEVSDLPGKVKLRPDELRMAKQLIDSMRGEWRPTDFRDTYTDRVNELIKAKKAKKDYSPADEAPTATDAVDLMEALRQSVDAAKRGGRSPAVKKSPAKKPAARKPAAKKSAAKKPAAKKSAARKKAA